MVILFIQNNSWFNDKLNYAYTSVDVKYIFGSACLSASLAD